MFKVEFVRGKAMRTAEGVLFGAFLGSVFWLGVIFVIGWFA